MTNDKWQMPNIELHIERLVLDGLPLAALDGARVRVAVEAELLRLLAEGGIGSAWLAGGAVPSLRVGDVSVQAGAAPAHLGGQIASAVYGGIGATANSHEVKS